jgi:hypothetical protein
MKSLLGPRVVPMRMEDFAVESVTARKAAAAKVLLQLNLRFDDALLGELAHVFAVPMDAPADFLQSEYGRWQHALTTEEEKQAYFDAAKPALEAFGYTMGMGADQYKVRRNSYTGGNSYTEEIPVHRALMTIQTTPGTQGFLH